jgi:hypothetical protein
MKDFGGEIEARVVRSGRDGCGGCGASVGRRVCGLSVLRLAIRRGCGSGCSCGCGGDARGQEFLRLNRHCA